MALLLPFTMGGSPIAGVIMLAGIFYGAMYGGSITSILVNIPGEAASVVTCLDGYQMARQGRAGPALGVAAFGSFIAGTLGVIGLMFLANPLNIKSMNKNHYCVIMAGGVGSRFWPLSRSVRPKQFLDILGTGKTLIRQTFERFEQIFPLDNIFVVTSTDYGQVVHEQIPEIPYDNILMESMRRNTAPCIAYACYKIKHRNPKASMIVAPSDHLIIKEARFLDVVEQGLDFVKKEDALLTLGIKPSRPETGYGYIQIGRSSAKSKIHSKNLSKVKTFTEKPDLKLARVFYESGEFYWNAGIFLWSLSSILNAFETYLPDVNSIFAEGEGHYYTDKERDFIDNAYAECKSISIDYGVMEKADNVYVITSDFGWSDLGTWGSLYEQLDKDENENSITGDQVMPYELQNCLVNVPWDKLVVLQGLKDYIVVESDDILLVCRMKDEQKIRNFVQDVQMKLGEDYI